MKYKAILFDLGNTLIHFTGNWSDVFSLADQRLYRHLVSLGFKLDRDEFKIKFRKRIINHQVQREIDFIEHSTSKILKLLLAELGYGNLSEETIATALEVMYQQSQKFWLPEKETISVLTALKAKGYKLGIISNAGDDADVQLLVDKAEIRPLLDFVISSAAHGIRKPSPEIFTSALENWPGITLDETVMVGDTLNADILGANNLGIFSVWVTRRVNFPLVSAKDREIHANATIENINLLPNLLSEIS